MKKFVIILLAVCLVFAAVAGYFLGRNVAAKEPVETEVPVETATESPAATAEPVEAETLDYEAIYALHDPEETVMIIDGEEINWGGIFQLAVHERNADRTILCSYG